MPHRRDIRRLAMQTLYQLDLRGEADLEAVHESLRDGPDSAEVQRQAWDLAQAAWERHAHADALVVELAPAWPTHRQPPVDRALLRLAYHEMVAQYAPVKVVINEAVELAKEFCSEHSPAFVNGVLDKMAKRLAARAASDEPPASASASAPPGPPPAAGPPRGGDLPSSAV